MTAIRLTGSRSSKPACYPCKLLCMSEPKGFMFWIAVLTSRETGAIRWNKNRRVFTGPNQKNPALVLLSLNRKQILVLIWFALKHTQSTVKIAKMTGVTLPYTWTTWPEVHGSRSSNTSSHQEGYRKKMYTSHLNRALWLVTKTHSLSCIILGIVTFQRRISVLMDAPLAPALPPFQGGRMRFICITIIPDSWLYNTIATGAP